MTYASAPDVVKLLGSIGTRLPDWLNLEDYIDVAHGLTLDALSSSYPAKIPAFEGPGLEVVKWAEAKLAAAEALSAIRINLPESAREVPDEMRAEAYATLGRAVVGYPLDSEAVDVDGNPATPSVVVTTAPRISSFTPMSAFGDPYEAARKAYGSEVSW